MTCIAWDGFTLAADKRMCFGTMVSVTTKIWRCGDKLIGGAGEYGSVQAMRAWIEAGAAEDKFPEIQRSDDWAHIIVVDGSGAYVYEKTPHPVRYDQPRITIGSGREFAMAALYLGKNAREAVEVACALDRGCGNGIDTLTLEQA